MISWNLSYDVLMDEYVGRTKNGAPAPNLQTPDPKIEAQVAKWYRENPSSGDHGDFWDRRWAEYKALDPSLTDEKRPSWLKPSVTVRENERLKAEAKVSTFVHKFFAL